MKYKWWVTYGSYSLITYSSPYTLCIHSSLFSYIINSTCLSLLCISLTLNLLIIVFKTFQFCANGNLNLVTALLNPFRLGDAYNLLVYWFFSATWMLGSFLTFIDSETRRCNRFGPVLIRTYP
jgi:hypothetical protein